MAYLQSERKNVGNEHFLPIKLILKQYPQFFLLPINFFLSPWNNANTFHFYRFIYIKLSRITNLKEKRKKANRKFVSLYICRTNKKICSIVPCGFFFVSSYFFICGKRDIPTTITMSRWIEMQKYSKNIADFFAFDEHRSRFWRERLNVEFKMIFCRAVESIILGFSHKSRWESCTSVHFCLKVSISVYSGKTGLQLY